MKSRFILCLALLACASFVDAAPIKIHFISGAREYKSEASLKEFIPWLEKSYGVKCTVSWGYDGIKELPNLAPLKEADVLFVFARRMKLGEDQMTLIRAHWEAGKPVVGVRTASHAFQNWLSFDEKVLGGNYKMHWKHGPKAKVRFEPKSVNHPLVEGVMEFDSAGRH